MKVNNINLQQPETVGGKQDEPESDQESESEEEESEDSSISEGSDQEEEDHKAEEVDQVADLDLTARRNGGEDSQREIMLDPAKIDISTS